MHFTQQGTVDLNSKINWHTILINSLRFKFGQQQDSNIECIIITTMVAGCPWGGLLVYMYFQLVEFLLQYVTWHHKMGGKLHLNEKLISI